MELQVIVEVQLEVSDLSMSSSTIMREHHHLAVKLAALLNVISVCGGFTSSHSQSGSRPAILSRSDSPPQVMCFFLNAAAAAARSDLEWVVSFSPRVGFTAHITQTLLGRIPTELLNRTT